MTSIPKKRTRLRRPWSGVGVLLGLAALRIGLLVSADTGLDLWAAERTAAENSASIARVDQDIRYLTSPELEGRGAGTAGIALAADFLRGEFRKHGLTSGTGDGSYYQPFTIPLDTLAVPEATRLVLRGPDGKDWKLQWDTDYRALAVGGAGKSSAEVVFAGYGISAPQLEYDDYTGQNVAGKVVIVIRREPQQDDPKSRFDGKKVTPHSYILKKIEAAKAAGAAALLFVNDPFSLRPEKEGDPPKTDSLTPVSGFGSAGQNLPLAQLTIAAMDQLLSTTPLLDHQQQPLKSVAAIEAVIDANYRPLTQTLAGWTADFEFTFKTEEAELVNVVGVLDGVGPHAEETIVIGAHYDHLGFGPFGSRKPDPRALHPGADDNASGTAAIVELARRYAAREQKPSRRLVFVGFSGEERGLLGSNHYVAQPLLPLEKTIAMLNFDMIGRLRDDRLFVNAARTGAEFSRLLDQANVGPPLKLKIEDNVNSGDHGGFYRRNIPSIHFFSGITDDYHTPDDVYEKIDVAGVVRTVDFVERFLDHLLELPQPPQFVKLDRNGRGTPGAVAFLGITPDYASQDAGVRVARIADKSPATTAGVMVGDRITKLGDVPVQDIPGLLTGLRKFKPGEKVALLLQRGDQQVTTEVTLGQPMPNP
jgi:hypothetical protein